MTNEEIKVKAKADAENAKVNAANVAEAKKVRAKELSHLTFEERVLELRKVNPQVGVSDGTGLSNSTSARRNSTGAVLTVINDEKKYSIELDLIYESSWKGMALQAGEILGVKFDTKEFDKTTSQVNQIKEAQKVAKEAGGHFVLDK